ncbi:MAG: PIN domain-containing protein [Melioribacteraceae bacterium]|nr:PIN domain-containing protein [Melioribacteraceae bacterium]MCF8263991.1 PIN domain-containing protein [Melioribacteraceae bacterium]MCF8430748.1 PIN domain-containing protein [Melioribacteraceae bacterium]
MSKIFIDTNVFIYALDKNSKYHEWSKTILTDSKIDLLTTTKNISEFFAVTTKFGLQFESTFSFYKEMRKNCTILFPSEKSLTKFANLLEKYPSKGNRVFDSEIASILSNGLNRLASLNKRDFEEITEIKTEIL